MSSLVGHAAAGLTIYLCCYAKHGAPSRYAVMPFVGLAIVPDLDYFAVWLFDYAANPRISHSLVFMLAVVVMVRVMASSKGNVRLPLAGLLLAGFSHACLDLLVGAHPVPMFWPFDEGVMSPVGVLPSAGTLSLSNAYLWRNLIIELGVLAPVFAFSIAICRGASRRGLLAWTVLVSPIWVMFVAGSVALGR